MRVSRYSYACITQRESRQQIVDWKEKGNPRTGFLCYDGIMPGNSFGELFRITTAGVSHGPGYRSASSMAVLRVCRLASMIYCPIFAAAGRDSQKSLPNVRKKISPRSGPAYLREKRTAPRLASSSATPIMQPRLQRYSRQVPAWTRGLHVRRQVWAARLSRRGTIQRLANRVPCRGCRDRQETLG